VGHHLDHAFVLLGGLLFFPFETDPPFATKLGEHIVAAAAHLTEEVPLRLFSQLL
jgi:hypothetical protein